MEDAQRFFFLKKPTKKVLKRLNRMSIGKNLDIRKSPDKSEIFIKTNGVLLKKELKLFDKISKFIADNLIIEVTYKQAFEKLKTWDGKTK